MLAELSERSLRVEEIVVHFYSGETVRIDTNRRAPGNAPSGMLISQAEVETALRRRLGDLGGEVEWGREFIDAIPRSDGLTVCVAGNENIQASWLIGCDGAHSRVRKSAGIKFAGAPLSEQFLLADVDGDFPFSRDAIQTYLSSENSISVIPLPGGVWRLIASTASESGDEPDSAVVQQRLMTILEELTGCNSSIVRNVGWASSYRIQRRLADSYRRDRILLAGDAAHIHSPFGGQGINTGLGDAENLAWKLALVAAGRADHRLLDSYEAERRPVASKVLRSTTSSTALVLGTSTPAKLFRRCVLLPLLRSARVQRHIVEQAAQLNLSYRGGPLASPGRRNRHFAGGGRVLDMNCRRTDGSETHLHVELDGHWVLIEPVAAESTARAAVLRTIGADAVTILERADGRSPESLLVRPDGHLAERGTPEQIEKWVAEMLLPEHTE
ncbi:oxygenase [Nocardia wallacei]|uniref:Oxygenase n=1 Tax=Nocardia wallacei TaxID=480035 RepID=A0A7G1KM69_9NOCA|nr:oxygenase [Nocardia wallacei]